MPKTLTLQGISFEVVRATAMSAEGEPMPITLLSLFDPADGTTYVIPWEEDARRRLVTMLTGGVILGNGRPPPDEHVI